MFLKDNFKLILNSAGDIPLKNTHALSTLVQYI